VTNAAGAQLECLYIQTQAAWDAWAAKLAAQKEIAFDLEGNGFHRFPEKICLIQCATSSAVAVIDPLAIGDLSALGRILASDRVLKIFHACDYDLRSLQRDFHFQTRTIFDTSLAAKFIGVQHLGLESLMKELLGIELGKTKSMQRQDWTKRPLSEASLHYALQDVAYLIELKNILLERLKGLKREAWVAEENLRLEKILYVPPLPPEEQCWLVKGVKSLAPRQRMIFHTLYIFRHEMALATGKPYFRIFSDQIILEIAKNPLQPISKVKELRIVARLGKTKEYRQRIKAALSDPLIALGKPKNVPIRRSHARPNPLLQHLKAWRQTKAEQWRLDPALIWPLSNLEHLAFSNSDMESKLAMIQNAEEVRSWQRENILPELLKELEGAVSATNVAQSEALRP
jgi:ribonuclease D